MKKGIRCLLLALMMLFMFCVSVAAAEQTEAQLYYVTDAKLYSLQNLLNRILQDVQFLNSSTMTNAGVAATTQMPSVSIRMAISVVGILPIMVLYPFFQKYFVKGIAVGAVKG